MQRKPRAKGAVQVQTTEAHRPCERGTVGAGTGPGGKKMRYAQSAQRAAPAGLLTQLISAADIVLHMGHVLLELVNDGLHRVPDADHTNHRSVGDHW